MALKAVIFDFGRVLSGPPDPKAHAEMRSICGLSNEQFEPLYWADRPAYDEGKFTGIALWERFLSTANLPPNPELVAALNDLDARMWTKSDPAILDWHGQLKTAGLQTAILSNMGDTVEEKIERELDWVKNFEVRIWSHRLRLAKPDPRIYLHTLEQLGIQPQESLFLDDKQENIDAAHALEMQTLLYSNMKQLRVDLVAAGLDRELPLPPIA